jgi:hypothetical protein
MMSKKNIAFFGAYLIILLVAIFSPDSMASSCRSYNVKRQFDRQQGYPHGRKGYIVDHICALSVGGIDSTINMQYQTTVESKAKDKIEGTLYGKALWCTPLNSTKTRHVLNCK